MTDAQRKKRNFRARKIWKLFKLKKKKECGGIDLITLSKLSKRWELHHEDLREENYEVLNDNFLPCNNQTHEMVHWLYRYYRDRDMPFPFPHIHLSDSVYILLDYHY